MRTDWLVWRRQFLRLFRRPNFSVVSLVRNTLKYVASKDRKEFSTDLKKIYTAPDEKSAAVVRDQISEKWSKKISAFYEKLVCKLGRDRSSNIRRRCGLWFIPQMLLRVEGSTYRQRSVFPNDAALLKALFLATEQATVKWTIPIQNCDLTANFLLCLANVYLYRILSEAYLQKFFRTSFPLSRRRANPSRLPEYLPQFWCRTHSKATE